MLFKMMPDQNSLISIRISPATAVVSSPTVMARSAPSASSKASSAQWSMNTALIPRALLQQLFFADLNKTAF